MVRHWNRLPREVVESLEKTYRYGTSGHGLAGIVVLGWQLDFMILEVFSNLNDSMILRSCTGVRVMPGTNAGWVENGLRAALRRKAWGCWLTRNPTWCSNVLSQPRWPAMSWAVSKEAWPAGQGRWFCPFTLLQCDPTWSVASSSGALSLWKTWTCWSGSRGGPQKWSEGWNTSPIRQGWESWGCSAWRREGCRDLFLQPSSTWSGPTRELERHFWQVHVVIEQGIMALNWKRVDLEQM